jgi:hypothetical protein
MAFIRVSLEAEQEIGDIRAFLQPHCGYVAKIELSESELLQYPRTSKYKIEGEWIPEGDTEIFCLLQNIDGKVVFREFITSQWNTLKSSKTRT